MAQPEIRKRCTVTSIIADTVVILTPTTNAKSPAVVADTIDWNFTTGTAADFFAGSGRYDVIVRRL